ncbi:hypothetical protein KN248_019670 [Mycobacterium paraintracellulare]|uniref:hypothetical protein n=1 Tax=Mycobacterium avium complex (MAC) TaxID=120793 RepID=UPI001EEED3B6|nr:hypothetical protein [Mycobacterium paraintracellulare]WVL47472.1 hypothetical protein KN248_019670 [Mycobacterium paraintracellulare]
MTPQSAEPQPSYQQSLARLEESKPRIAHALREADERRIKRLAALADGMRLRGLEQLHVYLDAAAESYASLPPIADIAFLLARVRADFQTALEATLSGYQGVAADAMRDVMEVEGLLLDFAATPANIQEWLQADRRLRMRKYGPAQVRDRLKDAGISPYSDEGFEPVDYRAHSEALHVTPSQLPTSGRGPEPVEDPLGLWADVGFIEMFEHGDRILTAIELLRVVALGAPDDYKPLTARDDFDNAHARTYQMQVMLTALISGPAALAATLGREPTTVELLEYVRDELALKSRPFGPPDS